MQVNGCLSFSDKISDGFYNILGMDPHLWAMCNESEEGRRMPLLMALKAVDPTESSLEVVLVDRHGDSGLMKLENRALELYYASGITLELVKKLAILVSDSMGYVHDYLVSDYLGSYYCLFNLSIFWGFEVVHSKQSKEIFIGNGKDMVNS